jgi:hypothetical protein
MIDTIVSVVGIVAVVGIGFGCYAVACISPPVTKWLDMARPKESDQPEVSRTTKAGQELLQAAAEAIAIAKGEAPKDSYRIHIPTKPCTFCLGTGLKSLNDRHNPNSIDCPGCNGTGEAPEVKP